MISLTLAPEAVNEFQLPPGVNNEAPSFLSFKAQLAWLILFVLKNAIHASVSLILTPPLPSALTVPHSVANSAMPLSSAVCALFRYD